MPGVGATVLNKFFVQGPKTAGIKTQPWGLARISVELLSTMISFLKRYRLTFKCYPAAQHEILIEALNPVKSGLS
jgi:hypothetical protein